MKLKRKQQTWWVIKDADGVYQHDIIVSLYNWKTKREVPKSWVPPGGKIVRVKLIEV